MIYGSMHHARHDAEKETNQMTETEYLIQQRMLIAMYRDIHGPPNSWPEIKEINEV